MTAPALSMGGPRWGGVSVSPRRPRTLVSTNGWKNLPTGSSEQAFEVWNEYRIRDFRMKLNEPHLTLRQAQREDLILSVSKHKLRATAAAG